MSKNIFVNLPVKDLNRSKAFFSTLGYEFNAQFTDENAACMVVSENIFVMLLVESFFKTFTPKNIADASKTCEVMVALSQESRQSVDKLCDAALKAGARSFREPADHGFMYQRAFEDLDGHVWEHVWMDPAAVKG